AINLDIAMMIQSMGGTTLPGAYDTAIRAENCLIQAGKLAPRPPMPLYLDMGNPTTSQAPELNPIPTPRNQSNNEASTSSNTSKELQEVMKQLQNLGNELVTIKRQQAQSARPYQPQAQYQARPSYQQNRPPPPQVVNQNQKPRTTSGCQAISTV
ncbi:hypothetical protein KI387_033353, partial [Taxus chinensis]